MVSLNSYKDIMSIFIIHHYSVRRIPYPSLLPSGLLPIILNGTLAILLRDHQISQPWLTPNTYFRMLEHTQ